MLRIAPHRLGIAVTLTFGVALAGYATETGILLVSSALAQESATTRPATREAAVRPESREALWAAFADAIEAGDEMALRGLIATNGPISNRAAGYVARQHAAGGQMRKALLAHGDAAAVDEFIQGFMLPVPTPGTTIATLRRGAAGEWDEETERNWPAVEVDGAWYLDLRLPPEDAETWNGTDAEQTLINMLRSAQAAVYVSRAFDTVTAAAREPGVESLADVRAALEEAVRQPDQQAALRERVLEDVRDAIEFVRLIRHEGDRRGHEYVSETASAMLTELEAGEAALTQQMNQPAHE